MKQEVTSGKDEIPKSTERTLKRYDLSSRRKTEQIVPQNATKVIQKSSASGQSSGQLKSIHRRQESDSKLGNSSAFARAFRRESSDFFPSTRHSAYLQKSEPRSSIFASGNRRGSEISVAGISGKKGSGLSSGEPVLTDFSFGREPPQRPRREKTESEIVFGNRQQDYLRERDARLLRHDDSRRRSFKPADTTSDDGTIKSTASTTASEYSPVITQVSLGRNKQTNNR